MAKAVFSVSVKQKKMKKSDTLIIDH